MVNWRNNVPGNRGGTVVLEKQTDENISGQSGMAGSLPSGDSNTTAKFHKHVLLAEDDPIIQEAVTRYLNLLGYSCDAVDNGREALQALAERDYDLVLMDHMMPVMDGFEAAGIIRDPESKVRNHTVPVIAMTGGTASQTPSRFLAAGMSDYLAKPFYLSELESVLDKWLPNSPLNDGDGGTAHSGSQTHYENDAAVLSLFIAKAPEYVAALKNSVKERNTADIRHHAHKLAGAAAAIRASAVAGLAAEMEEFSFSNEISEAEQKQRQLSEAFENLLASLTSKS